MCVQQLNWREIGDFLDFSARRRLPCELQFAYQPSGVSLLSLPEARRGEVVAFLESLIARFGESAVHPVLSAMRDSLGP